MSRPRRAAAAAERPQTPTTSVTVERPTSYPSDESKKSIRLTVKMPSNKLREATSGGTTASRRPQVTVNSRDSFEPGEILTGPRGSRAKRAIVEESESEEEEDEEEDAYGEDDDEEMDAPGEEDEDAEGESDADADADADADMDDAPPPPPIVKAHPPVSPSTKPKLIVTPASDAKRLRSVESKEVADGSDDEELSSLDSVDEEAGDEVEEEEAMQEGGEEDAEGEPDDEAVDEEDEEEDEESDELSASATPATGIGSRASTPDVSKMTKRQRSRLDEVMNMDLLELPSDVKQKKILSAEEHAMRRTEMARRRKNLSEQRNEEEKMETINKLLKKQAPKQQRRAAGLRNEADAGVGTPGSQGGDEPDRPRKTYVRWVSNAAGLRVGVPEEWLGGGELAKASGFEAQLQGALREQLAVPGVAT